MIKAGFKFKVLWPQNTSSKTIFKIRDYDKTKPNDKAYVSVMVDPIDLVEYDEIEILHINGLTASIYKEKLQITMYAEIKKVGAFISKESQPIAPVEEVVFDEGPMVEFLSDDLPF
ncbi:hypothetical protein HGB07_09195 [Candidatus Roizmanbacteria bacterium]|nr:hypothetical protein [Candidatus Roizmanbacteria bacterium]